MNSLKTNGGKGWGTLERPLYTPGLLLEDEDLTSGVNYTRRLTQLLFSSLFGCGVICGLRVGAVAECGGRHLKVTVEKGLGLDCFGNPIEVPAPVAVTYDPGCDKFPPSIWVVACYSDGDCAPRELSCCDAGEDRANTRRKAGYEIKLYGSQPKCVCSCEKPVEKRPHGDGDCRCPPQANVPRDQTAAEGPSEDTPASILDCEGGWSKCYDDHFNGVCSCGCGCNCILIGKIDLELGEDGSIFKGIANKDKIYEHVRKIRPMLVGMFEKRSGAGA
jgi:hypothetical protein